MEYPKEIYFYLPPPSDTATRKRLRRYPAC